jgi:hypothetical protein
MSRAPGETWKLVQVPPKILTRILARLGKTPLDRLHWAVDFAGKDLGALTPGDWLNLQLELEVFSTTHAAVPFQQEPFSFPHPRVEDVFDVDPLHGSKQMVRSDEEVRRVHQEFRRIFSDLIRTGQSDLGLFKFRLIASRRKGPTGKERASLLIKGLSNHVEHDTYMLADLLRMYGHLVKACPAPAPRSREVVECGAWFVADRPNKTYCSRRCQSRATTKVYRARKARKERRPQSRKLVAPQ